MINIKEGTRPKNSVYFGSNKTPIPKDILIHVIITDLIEPS
jgi:hypothetical protein